jgi:Fe-S oxidoreductase
MLTAAQVRLSQEPNHCATDFLNVLLVPGTEIEMIERCSGHDGTHGVKRTGYPHARKIAQAVAELLKRAQPAHLSSDCPMAVAHLAAGLESGAVATHRISLLRQAYGI